MFVQWNIMERRKEKNSMKMKREEVYKIIDSERFYQDSKWLELDQINNVGDFMIYMQKYLNEAMLYNNPITPDQSLDALRKVVAIGIGCFEKFGVPPRQ